MNTRNGRSSELPEASKVKNILLNNKENEKYLWILSCAGP
jgi:hypothetical protein